MNYCIECNKEIPNRNKNCSILCQKKYQYKEYIQNWKNGVQSGMRGNYQISMHIREYLYNKYNSKCARCGWGERNPYTNNIPLEIEHIDGNYLNNKEENIMKKNNKGELV